MLGKVRNMGLPVRFRGERRRAHRAPPLLGEHTDEVLLKAGYGPEAIAQLKARGVVADAGTRAAKTKPASGMAAVA